MGDIVDYSNQALCKCLRYQNIFLKKLKIMTPNLNIK